MIVPKKKTSKMRSRTRKAHDALSRSFAVVCPNCGEPVLRHRVCLSCGQYRGRRIFDLAVEEKS